MNIKINGLYQAMGFLTRVPMPKRFNHDAAIAESVPWYGPVGVFIGGCLCFLAFVFSSLLGLPAPVVAILVLMFWVGITGALHLDGLADCSDAWMGGFTAQRMLEIMKDTSCGVGAIVAVVLILLFKFAALTALIENSEIHDLLLLFLAPAMARMTLSLVILWFPYVRDQGLGDNLQTNLAQRSIWMVAGVISVLLLLISVEFFLFSVMACMVAVAFVYQIWIRKIRGATGDVYGATVEIAEALVLLALLM